MEWGAAGFGQWLKLGDLGGGDALQDGRGVPAVDVVSTLRRGAAGTWHGVGAGAEGMMERILRWAAMAALWVVVMREILAGVPRDVKRAAIVALALIVVGVIWLGRRRGK